MPVVDLLAVLSLTELPKSKSDCSRWKIWVKPPSFMVESADDKWAAQWRLATSSRDYPAFKVTFGEDHCSITGCEPHLDAEAGNQWTFQNPSFDDLPGWIDDLKEFMKSTKFLEHDNMRSRHPKDPLLQFWPITTWEMMPVVVRHPCIMLNSM